jgi:hypothetical protein
MRSIIIAFFILLSSVQCALAYKPVYADAGLWKTFNLTYKVNKRVGLLFTQEIRLRENYSRLNLLYNNVGVNYLLVKNLKVSFIYRNIQKVLPDNTFNIRHRIMTDAAYKYDYAKWNFSLRQRFQFEWMDIYTSEYGKTPQIFSRTKFEVQYQLTEKWAPYINTEFRVQLSDPRNTDDDDNLGRNRTIFGVDYTYNKTVNFGTYFLHQAEFNTVTPQVINIIGIETNINLNRVFESFKKKTPEPKVVPND